MGYWSKATIKAVTDAGLEADKANTFLTGWRACQAFDEFSGIVVRKNHEKNFYKPIVGTFELPTPEGKEMIVVRAHCMAWSNSALIILQT